MKKGFIISLVFLFFPLAGLAAPFEKDLYLGLKNDPDARSLQRFLQEQGLYNGPINGNFFGLTKEGVKKFQEREGIKPALGFFGRKTRDRINTFGASGDKKDSRKKSTADLTAQIKILQERLKESQKTSPAAPILTTPAIPAPTPPVTSIPDQTMVSLPSSPPAPPALRSNKLEIKGSGAALFPDTATNPLKIGDIYITNNTQAPVYINQIVVNVFDEMNSQLNRGREVFLVLRKGTVSGDEIISRSSLRFNSTVPLNGPHIGQANLSLATVSNPGESLVLGLWVDNLGYVISGSLKFELNSLLTTAPVETEGKFSFVMTR